MRIIEYNCYIRILIFISRFYVKASINRSNRSTRDQRAIQTLSITIAALLITKDAWIVRISLMGHCTLMSKTFSFTHSTKESRINHGFPVTTRTWSLFTKDAYLISRLIMCHIAEMANSSPFTLGTIYPSVLVFILMAFI